MVVIGCSAVVVGGALTHPAVVDESFWDQNKWSENRLGPCRVMLDVRGEQVKWALRLGEVPVGVGVVVVRG